MKRVNTFRLAAAGVSAAAYAALTIILAPVSYGAIQFRVSELLCILPFFIPTTAWGLFIGCILANLFTGNIMDIIFGSLATLLAVLCVRGSGKLGKNTGCCILACTSVVLLNAFIVGAVITEGYSGISIAEHPEIFWLNTLQVGLGEAGVMYLLGLPLMLYLPKKKFFSEFVMRANALS